MTDLIDIYVAGGGSRSEDGLSVTLPKGQLKPFDIQLRVIPTAVAMQGGGQKDQVTFTVLLHDEHLVEDSGRMTWIDHSCEVTLPVDQVRIVEESA